MSIKRVEKIDGRIEVDLKLSTRVSVKVPGAELQELVEKLYQFNERETDDLQMGGFVIDGRGIPTLHAQNEYGDKEEICGDEIRIVCRDLYQRLITFT
jgi:hypothetical protein